MSAAGFEALASFGRGDRSAQYFHASRAARRRSLDPALSRCRVASAKCRHLRNCQAAATAVRHVVIATPRSARCVWAEMRWRWTLKVL